MLIFETAYYHFCVSNNLDFLTMRVWAGVWLCVISLVVVALEGSFLLKYMTRFTEEIFITLTFLIFVSESIKFMVQVRRNIGEACL